MPSPSAEQERETRDRTVGGSVTSAEEGEILSAFDTAGLKVKSQAARAVLLAYARSTRVRDAVTAFLRNNIDVLSA